MAKKKIAEVAVEEPIVVTPPKKEQVVKNTWERKDRQYRTPSQWCDPGGR